MPPALPASSPPPNWVESNHPLGWLIDRLLAVGRLRRLRFWKARPAVHPHRRGPRHRWSQRRERL
jgi:hypothetical protein